VLVELVWLPQLQVHLLLVVVAVVVFNAQLLVELVELVVVVMVLLVPLVEAEQ
jgi:hypothetical protein